jgi:hypothetical protein
MPDPSNPSETTTLIWKLLNCTVTLYVCVSFAVWVATMPEGVAVKTTPDRTGDVVSIMKGVLVTAPCVDNDGYSVRGWSSFLLHRGRQIAAWHHFCMVRQSTMQQESNISNNASVARSNPTCNPVSTHLFCHAVCMPQQPEDNTPAYNSVCWQSTQCCRACMSNSRRCSSHEQGAGRCCWLKRCSWQ